MKEGILSAPEPAAGSTVEGFRLSPRQRRIWASQGGAEVGPWRSGCRIHLAGEVDRERLSRALSALVERHEALRTALVSPPGFRVPLQVIDGLPAAPAWSEDLDLSAAGGEDRERALETSWRELMAAPLDVARGPLVRARFVRLGAGAAVLELALPALALDARGFSPLVADLARAYREDGVATDAEPPVQHADISEWLNDLLAGEETEVARDYWRERARTAPTEPPFLRPAGPDFSPQLVSRAAIPSLAEAAAGGASALGIPVEAWLFTAWQALLGNLAEAPVAVGASLDGRRFAELLGVIGPLDRELPVVLRPDGQTRWSDLALDARNLLREAAERLEGFDAEAFAASGFEAPFAFEHRVSPEAAEAAGVRFSIVRRESTGERFAARLAAEEGPDGLALQVAFDPARLDAAEAERLLDRFVEAAHALAQDPSVRLADLAVASRAERQVAARANETGFDHRRPLLLHRLFEAQAAATPDAPAVEIVGRSFAYGELERRANRLARHLRRSGLGEESRVGIAIDRSFDLVVALLGVLKSGAAYVPLDPAYPRERLAYMAADSRLGAVIADDRWEEIFPEGGPRRIALDRDGEAIAGEADGSLAGDLDRPDRLAYVIYTSGSTGRPKGVMVSHGAIANRLLWMERRFPLAPEDAVIQKTPLSFDASIWEIFSPLIAGARLVLAEPGLPDAAYLLRLARETKATVLQLVPSMLGPLLEEIDLAEGAGLRRLFCGGEALAADLARRVAKSLGVEVHNLYGPTESAIDATSWPLAAGATGVVVPIGLPIDNVEAHVADRRGREAPLGWAGEVYLGGAGLARGYLGRPALAAERFVPDPWSGRPGARLFRTGDLARRTEDGALEFLGRADRQLKVRGFRIEPGEIESLLSRHPRVRRAAVDAREDGPGRSRLVAWVVPADEVGGLEAELAESLARQLPEHMVPAAFVRLRELPRTPSGKLDRAALPDPRVAGEGGRAPRSQTEQLLATLWSDLLGVEEVSAEDDFFVRGGNSLVAMQLVSRLRKVFEVELPIRVVFEAPTLERLADRIAGRKEGWDLAAAPIERAGAANPPLSFAQQRLWFLDHLDGGPSYNLPLSLRIQGPLDPRAVAACLHEIARRHEVLRATFGEENGLPVQRFRRHEPKALPLVELSALPEPEREEESLRLARAEARRPFDLARGPLLRTALLRLDALRWVALVTLHHIASDGWSMGILVRELGALYPAAAHGARSPLPELPVQYGDFARWQRDRLEGGLLDRLLAYFRGALAGAPPVLDLPLDRPRPPRRNFRGGRLAATLPRDSADALRALGRREGATTFMVLLALFDAWLHRLTGEEDLVVGTPIANRTRSEIEGLIGFFANTLVLRSKVDGRSSACEALARAREAILGAAAHQELPFERLVDDLQPERSLSHTPLFQVMLVFQNAPMAGLAVPGLSLMPLDLHSGTSKFDLTLELAETPQGLAGVFEYATDLFDEETVERFAELWQTFAADFAAAPECPISELSLLGKAAREQILGACPTVATPGERDPLSRRFARIAAARPDAVAVVDGDLQITYGALDRMAERVARDLAELGCRPEDRVALLLSASAGMIASILGVLKAGGTYVPIDPGSPEDRVAFLLSDAAALAVATERAHLPRLDPAVPKVLLDDLDSTARAPEAPARSEAGAEAGAYVIYTSGSTGRPKGVTVTHGNVDRLFAATDADFGFGPDDVWTLFHSYAFDFSVWEIWGALRYGGRLVIVPPLVSRAPDRLHELLARERVTVFNQTPSAFQQLQAADAAAGDDGLALRYVIFGGEALNLAALAPWFARHGDRRPELVNMYGITETTVHVTRRAIRRGDVGVRSLIGNPISDLSLHLLDRYGALVPAGVPGEMYVGGAGVARGYLGRPALSAERFVPDPFSGIAGARLYRSGDLARRLAGGEIEYLGRSDHQIKIRGFRVELGEIETALAAHPEVREAVVLLRRDDGQGRLVAYLVPRRPAAPPSHEEARRFLAARLPEYMLPAAIVVLGELPITTNGKLDRRALPAPGRERPDLADSFVAPRGAVEEALAESFAAVLGLERVGIDDNFFALGGDSMRILQVIAKIRESGLEVGVQQFYEQQTVRKLALALAPPADAGAGADEGEDALLAEIAGLSDEEIRIMLRERLAGSALEGGRE